MKAFRGTKRAQANLALGLQGFNSQISIWSLIESFTRVHPLPILLEVPCHVPNTWHCQNKTAHLVRWKLLRAQLRLCCCEFNLPVPFANVCKSRLCGYNEIVY